jgi:hypothetical protein
MPLDLYAQILLAEDMMENEKGKLRTGGVSLENSYQLVLDDRDRLV